MAENRKVVLITGCSAGGIGSALALEFHAQGHHVFATARSSAKMAHLRDAGIAALEMDVTSDASIATAVQAVTRDAGGKLDVLVNNAGVNHIMPFADASMASIRAVLDTNVAGVLAVTQAFLPLLVSARGVVANIGSVNQVFNPPFQVAYNASKAALAAISDTLRVELAPVGVRVVHIVTGAVSSHLMENKGAPADAVPEESMYSAIRQHIEKRAFLDKVKCATAEEYAKQVVHDLTKKKQPPVLYRAPTALVARILSIFMWHGMLVRDST